MLIINERVGISAEELNEKNQIKILEKYNMSFFKITLWKWQQKESVIWR